MPKGVHINSDDDPSKLESLRRRALAACDAAPPITFTVAEMGSLVFILEAIVQARRESIPNNVLRLPRFAG